MEVNYYLRFIVLVLFVGIDFDGLFGFYYSVAVTVSDVMCCTEVPIGIYVSIAAIGNSVRTTIFVMELSIRTDVITKTVRTCKKEKLYSLNTKIIPNCKIIE